MRQSHAKLRPTMTSSTCAYSIHFSFIHSLHALAYSLNSSVSERKPMSDHSPAPVLQAGVKGGRLGSLTLPFAGTQKPYHQPTVHHNHTISLFNCNLSRQPNEQESIIAYTENKYKNTQSKDRQSKTVRHMDRARVPYLGDHYV